jgi:AMMECR1 domain-containing protein
VPLEHGWDRIAFLEQTCRKAGLPPDAWQTGAKLEAFTAEIFADPE